MNDYDDGYDPNGERYTPELVLYKGFEEALKVLETLLKNENGYMQPEQSGIYLYRSAD